MIDFSIQYLNNSMVENFDWLSIIAGGMAIAILIGAFLMMFTTILTTKDK